MNRVAEIRSVIRAAEHQLYARRPMLARSDAIALLLGVGSALGMVFSVLLYMRGAFPAWAVVLVNAFLASILHEIDHDLIHRLYFRRNRALHHGMTFLVWLFRGNIVHGWFRRAMHLQHHRFSGTTTDLEERLLGLGTRWGLRRLLASLDPAAAFILNGRTLAMEFPEFRRSRIFWASFPVHSIFLAVGSSFLISELATGVLMTDTDMHATFAAVSVWCRPLVVGWILPNMIRHACLVLVSSNIHYYENVDDEMEETQVLQHVLTWPLQAFCFNFGGTHAIHHFVVDQPFFVRQWIAPKVLPALRELGVRFDDFGTLRRANRLPANEQAHGS